MEGINDNLTLSEDSFLSPDVCLQLCSSDIDAHRLWKVTDSLGYHRFGCVTRLEPGSLQPHILTLIQRENTYLNKKAQTIAPICNLFKK